MSQIEFSASKKNQLIDKLQNYFINELDIELAQFDADFLLDFISAQLGAHYYNQGLHDAKALIESRLEHITEALYEIEKEI
ncbi:DUF2164 domain-containing protein [Pseudoalteromonas tunicata]|uniref:Uncharacterized protein n=1 Tax=Pseudoalteromonas tunicata D2 TaxID=87626 RepID=A4C4B5_9GAMM|nr:DUF2164 domain-containing protein [Pseudoalteromonas tunicata]ATC97121.1 hypothetical protein PTUN_b0784 [Pseudoalteromonas tunicata]AXT33229.1 DUF2164 domain-containing protein [Pseudoalteromonas tunicata]EAR30397.1 hypothetical protein PTD2_02471 [Pseudoalteromonas tunicata D2]MDP4984796.1 DUF2164 domain-containing protein [Pseudoalteromonas tunicata]